MSLKALAEAALQHCAPRTLPAQSSVERSAQYKPENSQDRTLQDDDSVAPDAARFWLNLTQRVDECDRLIHQLCDLRNDTSEHRTDLLAVRKTMAPNNLVGDIAYLKIAIAEVERPRCAPSFTPRQDRTPL